MAKKNNIEQCKTSREVISYATRHGGQIVSQNGSHVKIMGEGGFVIVPNHPGDLKTGTRRSIIKAMRAIGLAIFLFVALAVVAFLSNPSAFINATRQLLAVAL